MFAIQAPDKCNSLHITTTQQTPTGQQVVVRQDARPSDEAATIARHVNVHVGAYRQRL